jgi:hypothetical protein
MIQVVGGLIIDYGSVTHEEPVLRLVESAALSHLSSHLKYFHLLCLFLPPLLLLIVDFVLHSVILENFLDTLDVDIRALQRARLIDRELAVYVLFYCDGLLMAHLEA